MSTSYDVIVLGLGGMGSAALCHLAHRGARVLGIEQFPLVHRRGSSHGHTRVIRTAYYEHPDYVPLVRRAFDHWRDLEQHAGRPLLIDCPCLSLGDPIGELIAGVRMAVERYAIPAQVHPAAELPLVYPAVPARDGVCGVTDYRAGFLYVEECVRAHLEVAQQAGAEVRAEEPVLEWVLGDNAVSVRTAGGEYHAAKLVVTAGAWAGQLLADIGIPLTVMRQTQLWFMPHRPERFRRDQFPVFLADTPTGAFYGLPMIDPRGVKVARHYGAPELWSPDEVDWTVTDADEAPVRAFLDDYFPGQFGRRTHGEVCMYTLTTDRHFVIDLHPLHRNVAVAAGFSGHGFKFAPVVGEILADLALDGKTDLPIGLFRADRFPK